MINLSQFNNRIQYEITPAGCWIVINSKNMRMRIHTVEMQIRRVAFEIYNGRPPQKRLINTCNKKYCISPEHLKEADTVAGNAKLTEHDVIAIKKDCRLSYDIAESYGVSRDTIQAIKSRTSWKHIKGKHVVSKAQASSVDDFIYRREMNLIRRKPKTIQDILNEQVITVHTMKGCDVVIKPKQPDSKYPSVKYKNKTYHLHRLAYMNKFGNIPDNMNVCHRCDNPACINPDHLFLGTRKDNTQDMIKKGRVYRGKGESRQKLTEEQIIDIYKSPLSSYKLSKIYNVSSTQIRRIKSGSRCRRITNDIQ